MNLWETNNNAANMTLGWRLQSSLTKTDSLALQDYGNGALFSRGIKLKAKLLIFCKHNV